MLGGDLKKPKAGKLNVIRKHQATGELTPEIG